MSREETIKLFDDLKGDFRSFMLRIETKVDVATDNINKYAQDTIKHTVKIDNIEKDIDGLGKKVTKANDGVTSLKNKMYWVSGLVTGLVFVINYAFKVIK